MSHSKTVFMFSGQGSQYYQMGKPLFDNNAVFRQAMLRLDALAQQLSGTPVIASIYATGKADVFDRTALTHPAIFIIECALAECLLHAGIKPDLTLGSSLGSFAAAVVSGIIAVEDAMAAVLAQAHAFEASCQPGGMIAVLAEPSLFGERFLSDNSELAAVNFAKHFAVSAPRERLAEIEAELRRRDVTHQRLAVSFAFHSQWVDRAQAPFDAAMRAIPRARADLPMVCCEQADTLIDAPEDFFWRVVRQPIRLRDTIARLERQGAHRYIDVGPSGTMATFVKYALAPASPSSAHATLTPYGQDLKNLAALTALA